LAWVPLVMKASWDGVVLAESNRTVVVEGNHYFPPDSVRWEHLVESPSASWCWWKGRARYLTVAVDERANVNAAWYYPKPWPLARRIAGHVAFWAGVQITDD
jgi:uncharacterized protein (DUF427 family)